MAEITADIERETGLKLSLSQVRNSLRAFPRVTHDGVTDRMRIIADPDTNQ